MTETKAEKEQEKPAPIYVTRGAYSWGQGETAMKSFLNCLRNGSTLREFKIIKLPDGARDLQIDDFGTVMWAGSKEEAENIPFDAAFLERVKDELVDKLHDACSLMELLKDLDAGQHKYPVDDLNEITENLHDFEVKEFKEAG